MLRLSVGDCHQGFGGISAIDGIKVRIGLVGGIRQHIARGGADVIGVETFAQAVGVGRGNRQAVDLDVDRVGQRLTAATALGLVRCQLDWRASFNPAVEVLLFSSLKIRRRVTLSSSSSPGVVMAWL